jgi:hypothetical protein
MFSRLVGLLPARSEPGKKPRKASKDNVVMHEKKVQDTTTILSSTKTATNPLGDFSSTIQRMKQVAREKPTFKRHLQLVHRIMEPLDLHPSLLPSVREAARRL